MLLDLGHLHVTSDTAGSDPAQIAQACARDVVLFHVHDNFGARTRPHVAAPGVDPLRVDLHLAPGAGTIPWPRIAPVVAGHAAPLLLEVQPQHRPALAVMQGRPPPCSRTRATRARPPDTDDRRRSDVP